MLEWFFHNWGSIVVILVLAIIVGLIVWYLIRQKKQGKNLCGQKCSHCGGGGCGGDCSGCGDTCHGGK